MRTEIDYYETGINSPSELFLFLRAQGKEKTQALSEVARRYNIRGGSNVKQLAETCLRAEEREMTAIGGGH